MRRKIFVSYKYADRDVLKLNGIEDTKVRDYVTEIQNHFEDIAHIYKGESDDEDLSDFKDSTIESKLRDKIYDSSLTIVVISKNMKEYGKPEKDQWIPWEISYSIKNKSRKDTKSNTNAILAVVLPDRNGSYEYFIEENNCGDCRCKILKTQNLFGILRKNMFNKKGEPTLHCKINSSKPMYSDYGSYIYSVKWDDFMENSEKYIDIAYDIRENIDDYEIVRNVE